MINWKVRLRNVNFWLTAIPALLLVVQATFNMMVAVGIVPVTGQPLPFISKGGSAIVIMSLAMGIMLSVSRYAEYNTGKKKTAAAVAKELSGDDDKDAINPAQILK